MESGQSGYASELEKRLYNELRALAGEEKRLCIAFSGGVDSALLVKLGCNAGLEVYAVTFDSTLQPFGDTQLAESQARSYGAHHVVLHADPLADEAVRNNRRTRCYRCKYTLFSALREFAEQKGIEKVLDGTNADDYEVFRPGLQALGELCIESPLARCGVTKEQVRGLAAAIGLDVAARPSSPCLATRFPYDTVLTDAALARVGQAEQKLHGAGFSVVRVRSHDHLARIEVPTDDFARLCEKGAEIDRILRSLGFQQVTMDLAGYRSGSFDEH